MSLNELYEMTLKELNFVLINKRKGMAESLYKQAVIIGRLFNKDFPKNSEEAFPELYPPKKRYKMPDWMKERYYKRGR